MLTTMPTAYNNGRMGVIAPSLSMWNDVFENPLLSTVALQMDDSVRLTRGTHITKPSGASTPTNNAIP